MIAFARRRQRWGRLRRLPAVTLCGAEVALQANMELPAELPLVAQSGAHGVGLLRSEFLFMNRDDLPDEQAQTEIYTTIVEAMEGDPVTIRVLDWGGEKEIEALAAAGVGASAEDANPALGLRGIRMLLRHPGPATDPVLRDSPRRCRRPGAGDAAHGHQYVRGAGGAGAV